MVDEDDDPDEEVDIRILGDQMIKSFPWPIGVEIRRLLSGTCRNIDRLRLDQILKTAERSIQFTGFVLLSQLFEEALEGHLKPSDSFRNGLSSGMGALSLGSMASLLRSSLKVLKENEVSPFVEEMEKLDKSFLNQVDAFVPLRNEISHYQVNMPAEEIEKKCIEAGDLLTDLLSGLSFFANYRLVSIREIKVIKHRKEDARYLHVMNMLNNSDSDFKARNIEESAHTDSNAVILVKDLKSLRRFLNLSPLIIDTHSEVINSREKFNLRKDIFMYTKFRDDHIMYVGTETTEKCDLRVLNDYDHLLQEFKHLMELLGKKSGSDG